MGRIILRVVILLSLALNLAFLISHFPLGAKARSLTPEMQLSAAQLDRLQQVRQNFRARYETLKTDLSEKHARLINLLKQKDVDRAAVERCLSEMGDLQLRMQSLTVDEIIQCKGHLNQRQCECLLDNCAMKMGLNVKNGKICCKTQNP